MLDGFLSQVMLRQLRYCDSQAIRDGLAEVPHRERRAFPGASAPLLGPLTRFNPIFSLFKLRNP
jgi:hypothetical protein